MKLISNRALREFVDRHPGVEDLFKGWRRTVEKGDFSNWAELKQSFGTVDKVGDKTVFDVGGNKYRIIAHVRFEKQIIYIKAVLTHDEYDKDNWK